MYSEGIQKELAHQGPFEVHKVDGPDRISSLENELRIEGPDSVQKRFASEME